MDLNRVVITGLGVVTPYGYGLLRMMQGIKEGESTTRYMPQWGEYSGLRSMLGCPAELVGIEKIHRHKRRSMSKMSFHAVAAAEEALEHAGLDLSEVPANRVGTVTGSTMGSAISTNELYELIVPSKDLENIPSMLFFKCFSHTMSMNIAQYFEINGSVISTNAACASGLQSIGTGYEMIKLGNEDVLLCGGGEELHQTVTGVFDLLEATSKGHNDSPELTPRPFDRDRDGLVCGEGAGIVILENYEFASARGAKILAEVVGYRTMGSGAHISKSNATVMEACMRSAIKNAGLEPSDIDFVSAHATATLQGDQAEAEALGNVFGHGAPVSSLKGNIGHTMGGAGAIELAATIDMINNNTLLPGLNLENVAPECSGITHLMEPVETEVKYVLKNSFAFGGINCALVIKNWRT